jgi:hypothetical protein
MPYFDFNLNQLSSTSVTFNTILDGLLASTGILQQYPQHAEGQYSNGVFRLRQRIRLRRMECRFAFIGAQSNAVLAADLFNLVRLAIYVSKTNYAATVANYLTAVETGTNTIDVGGVYLDKTVPLPSQAYDTTITTPTPQVVNWEGSFDPALTLTCFSTTATGAGSAWDTEERDIVLSHVSDSALSPNPTVQGYVRIFFEYVNTRR